MQRVVRQFRGSTDFVRILGPIPTVRVLGGFHRFGRLNTAGTISFNCPRNVYITSMRNDEEIMLAVGKGDIDAFEEIVLRHQKTAWQVAYRFLGDAAEAEDAAQDAFMKILAAAPRYRPSATFRTFLYRVVSRLCIDRARKMHPIFTDEPPDAPDPRPSVSENLLTSERGREVRRALNTLPANQRIAIVLRYYEGLDYRSIADAMETTEKAIERLLARGRARLQQELADFLEKGY